MMGERVRRGLALIVSLFLAAISGSCASDRPRSPAPAYPERPSGFAPFDDADLRNPASWGFLNAHDPSIFHDPESGLFYAYSTDLQKGMYVTQGCQIRTSRDLIDWAFLGWALPGGTPEEAAEWANPVNLWAPDCVKAGSEYRLYYSASLFGKQRSAIGLAVSSSPEGPFVPRALVLKTDRGDPVNAIDPAVVYDEASGFWYMAYGSFWGGVHLLRLDPETGLVASGETGFGVQLACRPPSVSGAVEGPYLAFNRETGYWYLFVSYGSLSSNYNVRVGRSRSITGPYLDFNGIAMTDVSAPGESVGCKLTSGYRFADGQGWFALGHNSVLEHDGEWFLVHHVRPEGGQSWAYLNVRKMLWTEGGWPVANPLPYSGEREQALRVEDVAGNYDCVLFEDNPSDIVTPSVPLALKKDGSFVLKAREGKVCGRWTLSGLGRIDLAVDGKYKATDGKDLAIENKDSSTGGKDSPTGWSAELYALASWDPDRDSPAVSLTGMDCFGHGLWARKTVTLP